MSPIIDAAKTVGAWTATGSRALRGLCRFNHETRERVERIAAKLNFRPIPDGRLARLRTDEGHRGGGTVPHALGGNS